jgi:hypothetical protein
VFAVFADLRRAAERIRAIHRLEVLTDGPVGTGTRFRETRVMFGREATETMEIVDFQPGRSYSTAAESCGARYLCTYAFTPDGAGTRVRVSFAATPVSIGARLMAPLAGLFAKSALRALAADLEDLRGVCEADGGRVPSGR